MTRHREAQSCPPSHQYPSACLLSDGSEEPIRKPWLRAGTPKKTRTLLLPQCGGAVLCSGAVLCWGGGVVPCCGRGWGGRAARWGCAVGGGACCAVGPCCAGGGGGLCCAGGWGSGVPCGGAVLWGGGGRRAVRGALLCGGRGTVLCGGDVLLPGTRRALQPETVSMLLHMALTSERPLSGCSAAPSDSFYRLAGQPDLPFQGG